MIHSINQLGRTGSRIETPQSDRQRDRGSHRPSDRRSTLENSQKIEINTLK